MRNKAIKVKHPIKVVKLYLQDQGVHYKHTKEGQNDYNWSINETW